MDLKESKEMANSYLKEGDRLPDEVELGVFPGALATESVLDILKGAVKVGAQNVYWTERGGYTGEISAQMYADAGCDYALVGH